MLLIAGSMMCLLQQPQSSNVKSYNLHNHVRVVPEVASGEDGTYLDTVFMQSVNNMTSFSSLLYYIFIILLQYQAIHLKFKLQKGLDKLYDFIIQNHEASLFPEYSKPQSIDSNMETGLHLHPSQDPKLVVTDNLEEKRFQLSTPFFDQHNLESDKTCLTYSSADQFTCAGKEVPIQRPSDRQMIQIVQEFRSQFRGRRDSENLPDIPQLRFQSQCLVLIESFLSALYSSLSTIASKVFINILNSTVEDGMDGIDEFIQFYYSSLMFAFFAIFLILNFLVLQNMLSIFD